MPADVVLTLMRTKTISSEDFMGTQTYTLADGSKVPSQRFQIKSLKVGNKTLENVMASIVPATAQILLGQSFLSRFSSWSIDNEKHALVLN
jgi:predicted aspartyl protease